MRQIYDIDRSTSSKIFAHNLVTLRGKRRQREIAEILKIDVSSYQRYEKGQIPLKEEHYQAKLAEAFGVTVGRLFLDPDLSSVVSEPAVITPEEALAVLAEAIKSPPRSDLGIPTEITDAIRGLQEDEMRALRAFLRGIKNAHLLEPPNNDEETG